MGAFATALRSALLGASWSPGYQAIDGPDLTAFCGAFEAAVQASFVTPEGGFAVSLTNRTGTASVKGSLVALSGAADSSFILQANEYDAIGVVYDAGVADGSACRVVVSGIADVLLVDGVAGVRGYWVYAHPTNGRAGALAAPPGGGVTELDQHMREIGHCMQTVGSGTNVLVRVMLHFN